MNNFPNSLAMLALLADNVLPTKRRVLSTRRATISPEVFTLDGYDPDAIPLHRVTGGFNSVVEMAASCCLRVFDKDLGSPLLQVKISPDDLASFLASQTSLFQSPYLNLLKSHLVAGGDYTLHAAFTPVELSFSDPHNVCVKYQAPVFLTEPEENPQLELTSRQTVIQRRLQGVIPRVSASSITDISGFLGNIELTICCEYVFDPFREYRRVDVHADMMKADLKIDIPSGDVQRFYERFLTPEETRFKERLLLKPFVQLVPTISLVGRDPISANGVPEISDFDPIAFHLGKKPQQALVIAFNLKPGCQGAIPLVQHFIGKFDYGIISDQYLVERVCQHKWNLGGFHRALHFTRPIKVRRNGNEEDGVLDGVVVLRSLDNVTFETQSDTRMDYIALGGNPGSATLEPQSITLQDGTVLRPNEVPDLRISQSRPWSIFTIPEVVVSLSTDPELRLFQISAHNDAYQHLAKPFAYFPDSLQVLYTRLEAITSELIFLGNIPEAFL